LAFEAAPFGSGGTDGNRETAVVAETCRCESDDDPSVAADAGDVWGPPRGQVVRQRAAERVGDISLLRP